jgi:polyisoprenoid-binding protein YceI
MKPMRARRLAPILTMAAALAVSLGTAAAELRLLPAQSEIAFTSRQMGVPVQGRFKSFEADVDFDPARPEAARIALRIALASAAIGTAETEAELAKPGWFDTRRFPTASFVAGAVRPAGPGRFDIAGKLTIKGSARDLVVPVTLQQAGALTTADGSFVLRRSDWRIGDGDWSDTSLVADEVQVRFKLALSAGAKAP